MGSSGEAEPNLKILMSMQDFSPRYTRRAWWHDYHSRCIYMITLTCASGMPPLSIVDGKPWVPKVTETELGNAIVEEMRIMCQQYEELSILKKVIMPDHIHFILKVNDHTDYHLGTPISGLKGACSRRLWELSTNFNRIPLFRPNYHDRILTKSGQLDIMRNYIYDNPRRLLVKRENPDLFSRGNIVKIDGVEYDTLGNIFLLRNPLIEQVRVSRKFTQEQLTALDKKWKFTISEFGTLVSPFISPVEKVYRDLCIDNGGSLIMLEDNGMADRFKPGGKYFDLCAQGRLLIIAPREYVMQRNQITREKAMELNSLAAKLAAGKFDLQLRSALPRH